MPSDVVRPVLPPARERRHELEIPTVFAGFFLLGAFNTLKCFSGVIDAGYLPYWYISLTRGFTRRSLVGTLASPFMEGLSQDDATILAGTICAAAAFALLFAMTMGVCAVYRWQPTWQAKLLWLMVALVGFASPILPIVAIAVSALDQFLLLGALGLTTAVLSGRRLVAVILAILIPLIHEGFFFLAFPPLVWILLRRPGMRALPIACMSCIFVMTILLMTCTVQVGNFPPSAPLSPASIALFERYQLSQTASASAVERLDGFFLEWRRYSLATGLSVMPILARIIHRVIVLRSELATKDVARTCVVVAA